MARRAGPGGAGVATVVSKEYDHLFKLLIIGDSGK